MKCTKKKTRQRGGPGILREITGAIMKNTICKMDKEKKKISFSFDSLKKIVNFEPDKELKATRYKF